MNDPTLVALHAAVSAYQMPQKAKDLILSSHLLVIVGVTASGKNTLVNQLVESGKYAHVVSHTTRPPRANHGVMEKNGLEYWFVTPDQMLDLIHSGGFVEVESVHGETCYGTSIMAVQQVVDAGRSPLLEIDIKGALRLTKAVPGLRPVFILPPSFEVWMERLGTRGYMSDGERARRLESAKNELETAINNDAFLFVINLEAVEAGQEIMTGIVENHLEQSRRRELAKEIFAYLQ